ncbi:anthrone oxygenase family protein [Phytomonospora sp. NPDC050363]|uniref:anthrone oxygenase family protein n=1 Tax=Phytomonospora sp. NPDC050363 TaxID=3155642 RepID=UPI0033FDA414
MFDRLARVVALLSTGLLSGAFMYGAVNLVETFKVVPLDMRLSFHSALMRMNGAVMQTLMGVAIVSSITLALANRGLDRVLAAVAAALALTSLLVTRFGNVPINGRIKVWAVEGAPAGHAEILARWEAFNYLRTSTAIAAFVLVIVIVTLRRKTD